MKRLLVLVEGQTEQRFFNLILSPHLQTRNTSASCTMICTSAVLGQRKFRGGHGHRWVLVERDIKKLLGSNPDAVSTMLDLYGFPKDMPGFPTQLPPAATDRGVLFETALSTAINDQRFIPGILVHEFEGLLFSEPNQIAQQALPDESSRRSAVQALQAIRESFPSPEDINQGTQTAPSKRISGVIPSYAKVRHGVTIANNIGLNTIRKHCFVFNEWVHRLESI